MDSTFTLVEDPSARALRNSWYFSQWAMLQFGDVQTTVLGRVETLEADTEMLQVATGWNMTASLGSFLQDTHRGGSRTSFPLDRDTCRDARWDAVCLGYSAPLMCAESFHGPF